MSILHPIGKQFEGLVTAFEGKICIPLSQAATAMGISRNKVAQSLVKMEQKGLFEEGAVPYVENSVELVVRDRRHAPYAITLGNSDRICHLLEEAYLLLPDYRRWVNQSRTGKNAKNVKKAFLTFAEGMLNGKRMADNLRNSTRFFFDSDEPEEKPGRDIGDVLQELSGYAERLYNYVNSHPDNVYTEQLRNWLIALKQTLESWNTGVKALFTSAEAATAVEIAGKRLTAKYTDDFPQMLKVAEKRPVASSSLEEVQQSLVNAVTYLNRVDDEITDMRIRAAVIRIRTLLEEINEQYTLSDDNYSRSDARSLRNSYLPMLTSLVEHYMTYEYAKRTGQNVSYHPEETTGVLENDLPKALMRIRDELGKTGTLQMESEATALRQKLEMDGLI